MRVKVSFTIDINADGWAEEYGLERKDVRADVVTHVTNMATGAVAQLGLLTSDASNRESA